MHKPPEPRPAQDLRHPIVFRRAFVRRANGIQWALILVGWAVLLGAGVAALAALFLPDRSFAIPEYAAAGGALLFISGVIWGRLWRRHLRRAWWGELYRRWS